MTETMISMAAVNLLPGDLIDLEDDEYATMTPVERPHWLPEAARQMQLADHEATVMTFYFELAEVESVERETEDCVVVHTSLTSFGCPPDHMIPTKRET